MIASSHITLSDLNDPIQQDTAPPSAAEGALWLDTSQSPPVLKRFDGDDWEAVQDEEWLERKLSSVYAQISTETDAIRQEVKATYASSSDLGQMREQLTTLSEQTENNFTWAVSQINELAIDARASTQATEAQLELIRTYMNFSEDGLTIGKTGNPITFRVVNDRLAFYMNNTEVAYLSNNKLFVTSAEILTKLQIGKFAFEPQSNGNLSLIYTG